MLLPYAFAAGGNHCRPSRQYRHIGWCRSRYTSSAMCRSCYTLSGLRVHEFGQLFIDCTLRAEVAYDSVR